MSETPTGKDRSCMLCSSKVKPTEENVYSKIHNKYVHRTCIIDRLATNKTYLLARTLASEYNKENLNYPINVPSLKTKRVLGFSNIFTKKNK